jgi:hypothetical protein
MESTKAESFNLRCETFRKYFVPRGGNAISSPDYELKVITVPIANFEMQLNFPAYLNKKIRNYQRNRKCCYSRGTCYLEDEYASHTKALIG